MDVFKVLINSVKSFWMLNCKFYLNNISNRNWDFEAPNKMVH